MEGMTSDAPSLYARSPWLIHQHPDLDSVYICVCTVYFEFSCVFLTHTGTEVCGSSHSVDVGCVGGFYAFFGSLSGCRVCKIQLHALQSRRGNSHGDLYENLPSPMSGRVCAWYCFRFALYICWPRIVNRWDLVRSLVYSITRHSCEEGNRAWVSRIVWSKRKLLIFQRYIAMSNLFIATYCNLTRSSRS